MEPNFFRIASLETREKTQHHLKDNFKECCYLSFNCVMVFYLEYGNSCAVTQRIITKLKRERKTPSGTVGSIG